jgi:sulfofructose kinase
VLGVGHIAADLIFEVRTMPSQPVKTPAHRHRQVVGGMSANACVAAARLGAQVDFASPVGDDAWAAVFEAHLRAEGVRPSGLLRVAGEGSSVSAIVVDGRGDRMIVNCRGSALLAAPSWDAVPALAALTAGWQALKASDVSRPSPAMDGRTDSDDPVFDVVLVDPRCPAWAHTVLTSARAAGVPSVFDADVAPVEDLQRLVGLARWAVFSLPGLQAYMGITPGTPWSLSASAGFDASTLPAAEAPGPSPIEASNPGQTETGTGTECPVADAWIRDGLARALQAGAEVAVVTLGEHGLVWTGDASDAGAGDGEDRVLSLSHMAAPAVGPIVDTLAAGDVFHGALAVALAEGQGARDALRFAAAAAALKCLRPGGVLGAPERQAVDALLAAP